MIIKNAQVNMQAQHDFQSAQEQRLEVQWWNNRPQTSSMPNQDQLDLSTQARELTETTSTQQQETLRKNIELEISLLKMLVERLTGKKIELVDAESLLGNEKSIDIVGQSVSSNPEPDWGLTVDVHSQVHEIESLNFKANAVVQTSDGRSIDISLVFNQARDFKFSESLSLRAGAALKDPLVLNFTGSSIELSTETFEFDLDIDGELDSVPLLRSDSAFLALDNNRDGLINDGSELFGALSGDGFSDLSEHDDDGNQWIDEADAVFSRLTLYRPGADGQGQLISLSEAGVGAIYLGNIQTPFKLTNSDSQRLSGELRQSGIYLMESGEAGTVQQIDLSV